jgi:lipoic acid synthetase/lipoate-protein ligase A
MPDRSIVHGTLLYDTDFAALEEAIRPPVEKLVRHGIASVRQRVENLKTFLDPSDIGSIEKLEDYLLDHFCEETLNLTADDISRIEELESNYEIL